MMETSRYDVIVVGAGIEGSSTAYQSAKRGLNTLLLEQFPLPHTRGSSHGASRITRKAYRRQFCAHMMLDAYPMWDTLEKESDMVLYKNSGVLAVSKKSDTMVDDMMRALKALKLEHKRYDHKQLAEDFPMLSFNGDYHGVFEKEGGVLMADRALTAFQKVFVQRGGELRDGEPLVNIIPGDVVTVLTSKARYMATKLILTAGPWTNKILKPTGLVLPIKPLRIKVYYWRQKQPNYTIEAGYPCLIVNNGDLHFYSLPALEYPDLIKVCRHYGQEIDPDQRDVDTESYTDDDVEVTNLVRENMPGLEDKPSISETCIYSWTPDENFFLDFHPKYKNIIIGAGFSGHGFKLSPVVGRILVDLATGKTPPYEMQHFRINRFQTSPSKL